MEKNIKDLDDIDKALEEKSAEEIIGRKRNKRLRDTLKKQRDKQFQDGRGILLIPLLIVVLTLLILVLDRDRATGSSAAGTEASTEGGGADVDAAASDGLGEQALTEAETETEAPPETEDPTIVREYFDDVLENFFQRFFDAKLAADVETLYSMSDVTKHTAEEKERLRSQLEAQSGYIERYQDIRTYAVDALEKNAKLIFITYNVKFRRSETLAPAVMYCYVRVNEQNEFQLVENMTPTQARWINSYMTRHEEVTELVNATNSRLLEALSSDSRLAAIYDAFQTGRIYTEDQETIDSEVSLIAIKGREEETGWNGDTENADADSGEDGNAENAGSGEDGNAGSGEDMGSNAADGDSDAAAGEAGNAIEPESDVIPADMDAAGEIDAAEPAPA